MRQEQSAIDGDVPPTGDAPERRFVWHFGPRVGEIGGGGMASVLASYATLDLPHHRMRFTTTASLRTRTKSAEHVPGAVIALLRAASMSPTPVTHFHLSSNGSLVREGGLMRMARRLGLPTVATMHASLLDDEVRTNPERLRRVLGAAHVVHALGPTGARSMRTVLGQDAEVFVVPNFVALPPVTSDAGEQSPRALFAGLVSQRKGADVLAAAWPAVRAAVPDAELLVLGQAADALFPEGLEGVEWRRGVDRGEVLAELTGCRVAVLPARAEAQPMFILEAMAASRPLVTTPVAEIAGTVGDAGALVPPGDSGALAEAIIGYLSDPDRASADGRTARDRAARLFSNAYVTDELDTMYDTAVRRAGEHAGRTVGDPGGTA